MNNIISIIVWILDIISKIRELYLKIFVFPEYKYFNYGEKRKKIISETCNKLPTVIIKLITEYDYKFLGVRNQIIYNDNLIQSFKIIQETENNCELWGLLNGKMISLNNKEFPNNNTDFLNSKYNNNIISDIRSNIDNILIPIKANDGTFRTIYNIETKEYYTIPNEIQTTCISQLLLISKDKILLTMDNFIIILDTKNNIYTNISIENKNHLNLLPYPIILRSYIDSRELNLTCVICNFETEIFKYNINLPLWDPWDRYNNILTSILSNGKLVTASRNSVIIWNGNKEEYFGQCADLITCLEILKDDTIVTGLNNGHIIIWDKLDQCDSKNTHKILKIKKILHGHAFAVNSIRASKTHIVSLSYDKIIIWR